MVDQRLVMFIKNSLQKGLGRIEIEQALVQKGWNGVQISEAFVEAQATAASGTAKTIATASSGKTLYVLLGVLMILLVAVGVAIIFWPFAEECQSSRDCDTGYDCIGGECIFNEENRPVTKTTTTTPTITEDEPECYFDMDCDTGYECSEDYTCVKSTTMTVTTTTITTANINYLIDFVKLSSVSMSTLSFSVNVSNDEDSSSNRDNYLSCYVTDNVTYGNINNLTSLSLNKESGPDSLDSVVRTCSVSLNGTLLYSTFLSKSPIKITVNVTADYYDNINETDEDDNSKISYFEIFKENITFSLPTIVCSTDAGCTNLIGSGYECGNSGYCSAVVATASLGSDCSSLSCTSPYVCSSSNVCVECDSDTDCISGACDITTNTCLECIDDTDCTSGACDTTTNICVSATSTIACDDSVDNDADGLIDYRSGCDTDGDGLIDYVCGTYDTAQNHNLGYTSFGEVDFIGACDESWYNLEDDSYFDKSVLCGIDEDLDGVILNKDDGCSGALDISESSSIECSVDGDCDDNYKCVSSFCTAAEICYDSGDNDGDTYIDCLDSDCNLVDSCEYGTELTCDDSVDNDGDGKTDTDDSDCYECASDSDCGDEQYCSDYECVDKTTCTFDFSCKPYACEKSVGYCYLECSSGSECASGFGCSNGECVAQEDIDCGCEEGYYCTETGGECTVTKCNDGKDNDNDDTRDYYGIAFFSEDIYLDCKTDNVAEYIYSEFMGGSSPVFAENYFDNVDLDTDLEYICRQMFFDYFDTWYNSYDGTDYFCKGTCEIYNDFYEQCFDEYPEYFSINCIYYEADSYCDDDINANAEKEVTIGTLMSQTAELEQNIFIKILNFVIQSNPVIELFRNK